MPRRKRSLGKYGGRQLGRQESHWTPERATVVEFDRGRIASRIDPKVFLGLPFPFENVDERRAIRYSGD